MSRRAARVAGKRTAIDFDILPQPDETTCGPTCLAAVYRYFNDDYPLEQLIREIPRLPTGGTLAVHLGNHALRRGYSARIYSYNLQLFDPTWFAEGVDLAAKLRAQQAHRPPSDRLSIATEGYLEFLRLGGRILFEDLSTALLRRYLRRGLPVLTGLSATYLYREARVFGPKDDHDDVRGGPAGHFVVVRGYEKRRRLVEVADPLHQRPGFAGHVYEVTLERLVGAILLGVLTYDAILLVVEPPSPAEEPSAS